MKNISSRRRLAVDTAGFSQDWGRDCVVGSDMPPAIGKMPYLGILLPEYYMQAVSADTDFKWAVNLSLISD